MVDLAVFPFMEPPHLVLSVFVCSLQYISTIHWYSAGYISMSCLVESPFVDHGNIILKVYENHVFWLKPINWLVQSND